MAGIFNRDSSGPDLAQDNPVSLPNPSNTGLSPLRLAFPTLFLRRIDFEL